MLWRRVKFLEAREAQYQRERRGAGRDDPSLGSWDIVEARALRWVLTERLGVADDEAGRGE